jgi:homoserine kinase
MMNKHKHVRAFAPATCANLAAGFDILGASLSGLGDEVTLKASNQERINLSFSPAHFNIPIEANKNTAGAALTAMLNALNIVQGFDLHIQKNIPLSSGLGGSAASAVAAVVALNEYLHAPLTRSELTPFALIGEKAASGTIHADNVVPCLYGGIQLITSIDPIKSISLPVWPLYAALVRPHVTIDTQAARDLLPQNISLKDAVKQNAYLAGLISALYKHDSEQLSSCCKDLLIEKHRAHLIPYFNKVKENALNAGALACSISGAGPTIFALASSEDEALQIGRAMIKPYKFNQLSYDLYISPLGHKAAHIIEEKE